MKRPACDETERDIVHKLRKVERCWDAGWSDSACTQLVKSELCDLGKERGYTVYTNRTREKSFEWLFDLTWTEEDSDQLWSIPLVVESEWHRSDERVWDDFEKLLAARAEHRLMIVWRPRKAQAERLFENLIATIENFRLTQPGDRYLLACYTDDDEPGFQIRLHVAHGRR